MESCSGASGRAFVSELARLFQAYADTSSLECIALKATTVMQILLLQKPSRTSKTKDYVMHLQRHMDIWLDGDIQSLLDEGNCIQMRLCRSSPPLNNDNNSRIFRDLMLQGKVQSALRYLCKQTSGGVLKLDDLIPTTTSNEPVMQSTRNVKEKHPTCKDPPVSSLPAGDLTPVNPIIFEGLDADMIKQIALHTNGAAGPSGLDAHAWRRLCSSFKSASIALCVALACVGGRLVTSDINPEGECICCLSFNPTRQVSWCKTNLALVKSLEELLLRPS